MFRIKLTSGVVAETDTAEELAQLMCLLGGNKLTREVSQVLPQGLPQPIPYQNGQPVGLEAQVAQNFNASKEVPVGLLNAGAIMAGLKARGLQT